MFARFRKVNYWTDIGQIVGFHEAIEKLGSNWRLLNESEQGYTNANSIWGQLANNTRLKNKGTYDARKWLYNAWTQDRQDVRTTFYAKMGFDQSSTLETRSEENTRSQPDISNSKKVDILPSTSSDSSFKSESSDVRPIRTKKIERPRRILHFTLNYDEWRQFYDYKTEKNADNWSNQLAKYMPRVGLTCSVAFKRHHLKLHGSRKKNCNFFSCSGRCTISLCPVTLSVIVKDDPKNKTSPAVFTVYVFGDANHDRQKATASRPLRGHERNIIAQQVHKEGPLAVYERLLRSADENLLRDGNLTQTPSTDVLKTLLYEYLNKYRLDEDMFKEIRIFREITERWDETSKKIKGYVQKTGEWPFEVHFFSEPQINGFIRYCKRKTYSYLHIDATGSVVRKFKNQNQIYFYTMVYTDDTVNSILPASGALLSDHTTGSITAYFNNFRGKVGLLSKSARPSFVVIDFSPALLNSVLASFNVENVHNHLRRCSNTLDGAYSTSQLKDMTFVRLCCSHVIKAFSRSTYKLESSRDARRKIISLFVILLNTNNVNGAYDLYQHIMAIYANPYNQKSSDQLDLLLSTNYSNHDDIENYLDEKPDDGEDPHFLDEIDIGKDAIIHQSPFNVKACTRIPFINQIIRKEKLDKQATNQLYAPKVVQLFYKWFAYLPLWSCIMTEFIDRYASDGKNSSGDDWEFGFGRVSNASVESYFSIVKQSILQKRTRLRPMAFLMEMYFHTLSRFKAEKYGVPQRSRNRKSKEDNEHFLNTEDTWSRRSRSQSVGSRRSTYISDSASETRAFKISSKKINTKNNKLGQTSSDAESTPLLSKAEPNVNDANNSLTDSETSSDDSFHFSNKSSGQKTNQSGTFIVTDTNLLPSSFAANDLPIISEDSTEIDPIKITLTMDSTSTDTTDVSDSVRRSSRKRTPNRKYTTDYISPSVSPAVSPIISPKRSHSPSTKSASSSKTPTPVQKVRKKSKHSPINSPSYQQIMTKRKHGFTNIGTVQLAWPRFGIRSAIFEGRIYSVTNTCPLDTGLFILYYAYKSGTSEFRTLFQRDILEIYRIIRRTFQLVESDDWTTARLYWLTTFNLLENDDKIRVHDIQNTLTEIVFGLIRPMQEHQIRSTCSCDACPQQNRSNTNRVIEFRPVHGHYPDILPTFASDKTVLCGANLGSQEPTNYPAQYWFDDHFPIYDVETNTETITSRYICHADRTIHTLHFTHQPPPFLVLSVEKNRPLISQLPAILHVGSHEYRLIAGTNNTNRHFTAIIRTNDNRYVRYNDLHPQGCFPFDGMIPVDFVLYALNI